MVATKYNCLNKVFFRLFFLCCGCKSTHKNETNKQFIKKMRDKTTKILFYPAKRNKKILFILSLMILLPE
ncbi:hypothetical protein DWW88_03335 [Bacteroides cellulosilyticus]|uniref:Uncharacterized protein n=2 Tax=Bacteroides TaxID=816 RepID=A0A3D6AZK3_9BACE|nr:hypothetical protein F2Y86_08205 [Bacteroides cellulosilyticus]RGV55284.1 hypothetical protein DWW10_06940 [Bacteroides intestinalis]KAA5420490.1 hypothetical protein F2Y81_08280 [Bacteroides cellulosilyticus]KAA5421705.1 hypothetical protein F2Y87_04160 [Bacteroides cellulosilyticus]RGU29591.1 hypothetical protein DWW88_03335 [Bacteroides cellulosilyticus]